MRPPRDEAPKKSGLSTLQSVVVGGVITLLISLVSIHFTSKAATDQRRQDDRKKSFVKLVGIRNSYYAAELEALQAGFLVESARILIAAGVGGTPDSKMQLQERQWRFMEQATDSSRRARDIEHELYEDLGEVTVAFSDDPKILPMVQKLVAAEINYPTSAPADANTQWQRSVYKRFVDDLKANVREPLRLLINELSSKLNLPPFDADGALVAK